MKSIQTLIEAALELTCSAFEGAEDPPPKTRQPSPILADYSHRGLMHMAAALSVYAARSPSKDDAELSELLAHFGSGSPLVGAGWTASGQIAREIAAEMVNDRQRLITKLCKREELPRQRVMQRVNALLSLGVPDRALTLLRDNHITEVSLNHGIRRRMLKSLGHQLEADFLVQTRAIGDGEAPLPLYSCFQKAGPPVFQQSDEAHDNANRLRANLAFLQLAENDQELLKLALDNPSLVRTDFSIALIVAQILWYHHDRPAHLRERLLAAAARLGPINQQAWRNRFFKPDRALLVDRLRRLRDENAGLDLAEFAIRDVKRSGLPRFDLSSFDREIADALITLDWSNGQSAIDHILSGAAQTGIHCIDLWHDIHHLERRSQFDEPATVSDAEIEAAITERSRLFIKRAQQKSAGVILFSLHDGLPGYRLQVSEALARLNGFEPLEVTAGRRFEAEDMSLDKGMLSRAHLRPADQIRAVIDHLKGGGLLHLAADLKSLPGFKAFVPWLLRPYFIPVFPMHTALIRGASAAFAAAWIDNEQRLHSDMAEIKPPPDRGSDIVRAIWMTQRLARTIRRSHRDLGVTATAQQLRIYGGLPIPLPLIPLEEWISKPSAAESLFGWIAKPVANPEADVLSTPNGSLSRGALQRQSLRMASMLLHCRAVGPQVKPRDQRFSDQFRVLAILPPGETLFVLAFGAMASGIQLSVSQDDLPVQAHCQRIVAFDPDLVIAGADVWSRIRETDSDVDNRSVLICGDNADDGTLDDLLESFEPAETLPEFDADRPALTLFTSGSTGEPKGVVLPAGLCSGFSGMDRVSGVVAGDRAAVLGRWDTIVLAEEMAAVRRGGTLCIPPEGISGNPMELHAWLKDARISVFSVPVTIWAMLLASGKLKDALGDRVRIGVLWGERIARSIVAELTAQAPNTEFQLLYGATECCYMACGTLHPDMFDVYKGSPAGRPLKGVDFRIDLGGSGRDKAEFGNPSVSSPNAMLGYFDELITTNPLLAGIARPRIRIEDNARFTVTGEIDILGRSDSIIKVGGRRVSVLEIEAVAETVNGVKRAIAFSDDRAELTQVHLAVEAQREHHEHLAADIRTRIGEVLFSSLRPANIDIHQSFPVLAGGKTDRRRIRDKLFGFEGEMPVQPEQPIDKTNSRPVFKLPMLTKVAEWALDRGYSRAESFDPDADRPEFSSIELIELFMLAEEGTGTGPSADGFATARTWRDLADFLASGEDH